MAALEKIRKRAAILTIVIGAGLLAFILEEAVRASGAFRTDTLAAKVGDEKIDMQEFQNLQQARQQAQDPENKQDAAVLQQSLLQEIITNKIIDQECKDAGIVVTGSEVAEMLMTNPPQTIQQICQQNGMDPRTLIEQVKKLDSSEPGVAQIKALVEDETQKMAEQLKQYKLGMLMNGFFQANDIDIELTKQESAVYDVTYAKVDYTTIPDKEVKVTDAELKEAYSKYKELFKIDDQQRRIHYIKVDVDPSTKDRAEAAAKINKFYAALQAQPGIAGIRSSNELIVDSMYTTAADKQVFIYQGQNIKPESKDEVYNNLIAAGLNATDRKDPAGRDRNTFMYKVINEFATADSVVLDMVQVIGPKARQDSVMGLLAAGLSIDSLNAQQNPNFGGQVGTPSQAARGFMFADSLRSKVNAHLGGDFFVWNATGEGAVFARVQSAKPATRFYTIARAKYVDYPSEATRTDLHGKLQAYLNKYKDIKSFEKNAEAAKYDIQEAIINPATTQLGMQMTMYGPMGGVPDTRKAVKWAFDSKPGDISQIFEDDNAMVVVAVDDVYNDYMPLSNDQVKELLTNLVMNEKKGEKLMKQYNGKAKDVAGYAALMKTGVDSAQITMGPQQMLDARVAGTVAALGANAKGKVKVVAGRNALYAVQVNNVEPARELPKQQIAMQFRQMNFPQQAYSAIVQGSRKVKNNLIKFN